MGIKDETVVRVPGKCCPQCSSRSCSAAGQVYEVTFDAPHKGDFTIVFTHLPSTLPNTLPPALVSDSVRISTLVPNLLFFLYMESLYENVKLEGIRNT